MSLVEAFLLRLVLTPSARLPHGVRGASRPTGDLPSPPPCGWSFGFMTEPRTVGRVPNQRVLPALPLLTRMKSSFPTTPIVARQVKNIVIFMILIPKNYMPK